MKYAIDLFAGCGGASLGLKAAGYDAVDAVEMDPDIGGWHDRHVSSTRVQSVETWLGRWWPLNRPDLLWASPPCQPWSRAGKLKGHEDARDGFPITRTAIETLQPKHVIIENVRGSEAPMNALAAWMREHGYPTAQVVTLDAADYGVPQHRRRVILTTGAIPLRTHIDPKLLGLSPRPPRPGEGLGTQYDVVDQRLADFVSSRTTQVPWRTVRDALPTLAAEARVFGGGSNPGRGRGAHSELRTERDITDTPSPTIPASGGNCFPHAELRPEWWHRGVEMDEPARTIGSKGNTTIALSAAGSEPWRLDAPSCAVTCQDEKGTRASPSSGGRFNGGPDRASDVAYLAAGRRRLTVEECAMLQGFPDGLPWGDFRTKTLAYRGVGNAVPPKLAQALAEALEKP